MLNTLYPLNRLLLTELLTEAQIAHHAFETQLGHPDPAWSLWYADRIMAQLETLSGQQTNLASVKDGPVTSPAPSTGPFDLWSGVNPQISDHSQHNDARSFPECKFCNPREFMKNPYGAEINPQQEIISQIDAMNARMTYHSPALSDQTAQTVAQLKRADHDGCEESFPCWRDAVAVMNKPAQKDYDSDGSEGESYRDDYSSVSYAMSSDLGR